ncbi:MAG: hypothetical protein JWQ71_611 [Pedosphaera sp.]|nr:hypothetical protein [Pedosphaera sp.]
MKNELGYWLPLRLATLTEHVTLGGVSNKGYEIQKYRMEQRIHRYRALVWLRNGIPEWRGR